MLAEIRNINPTLKDLRKFGITFGIILTAILSYFLFKQKLASFWFLGVPGLFILVGIVFPALLRRFYQIWMSFAIGMQWIVTHVILTLLFYLTITPIGIVVRFLHKGNFSLRFKTNVKSFWQKREKKNFTIKDYERRF